jgi:hypothetical protein
MKRRNHILGSLRGRKTQRYCFIVRNRFGFLIQDEDDIVYEHAETWHDIGFIFQMFWTFVALERYESW